MRDKVNYLSILYGKMANWITRFQNWRKDHRKSWYLSIAVVIVVIIGSSRYAIDEQFDRTRAEFMVELMLHEDTRKDGLASEELLVENFERVALTYSEYGPEYELQRILKWGKEPIYVSLASDNSDGYWPSVKRYVVQLELLTGLELILVSDEFARDDLDQSQINHRNIVVYLVPRHEFPAIAERYGQSDNEIRAYLETVNCFALILSNRVGEPSTAVAVGGTDHGTEFAKACLLEEITQVFGLVNDSDLIEPSVFEHDKEFLVSELTINDQILLRTLYDSRITPGMDRVEALELVSRIIPELVEAVKRDGPEALYQR